MTQTLKKQLTALCVASLYGSALIWNLGASRAQTSKKSVRRLFGAEIPLVRLTRDEAATNFLALLESFRLGRANRTIPSGSKLNRADPNKMFSSYSVKSEKQLNSTLFELLSEMATQWSSSRYELRVLSQMNQAATIAIETPSSRSWRLFLIKEEDSWGVDIIETLAQWRGLNGTAKNQFASELISMDKRASCQTNLKQIALGMTQYIQDWDEKYPPAKSWGDILQPYIQNEAILNCPSLPKGSRYGYAYNSRLANKPQPSLPDITRTTSIYETSILKRNVYGTGENLAFRHQNGANYAFADGHVKWFPKTQIPSFKLKP